MAPQPEDRHTFARVVGALDFDKDLCRGQKDIQGSVENAERGLDGSGGGFRDGYDRGRHFEMLAYVVRLNTYQEGYRDAMNSGCAHGGAPRKSTRTRRPSERLTFSFSSFLLSHPRA